MKLIPVIHLRPPVGSCLPGAAQTCLDYVKNHPEEISVELCAGHISLLIDKNSTIPKPPENEDETYSEREFIRLWNSHGIAVTLKNRTYERF